MLYYWAPTSIRLRRKMAQVLDWQQQQTKQQARRSAFQIRMDILRVSAEGSVKPTHIMYRSNTSWIVMQKNLESLVASGFIRQTDESARVEYSITDSGRAVLRDYLNLLEKTATGPVEVRM